MNNPTDANSESELRDKIVHTFKRFRNYLCGPVPSDLLYGGPDVEPFDVLVDEAMAAFHQQLEAKVAEAILRTRLEVRGDYLFMMNTHAFGRPFSYEKVLQITKDAFKEIEEQLTPTNNNENQPNE